jgi:transposase
MARGKNFTKSEEDVIRLGLGNGKSVSAIAEFLNRGRASVYKRIEIMKARGDLNQVVLELGQGEDK